MMRSNRINTNNIDYSYYALAEQTNKTILDNNVVLAYIIGKYIAVHYEMFPRTCTWMEVNDELNEEKKKYFF